MAIYHLSVKTVSRSAGRSATAAAAYRAGASITDQRTGQIHDYTRKGGVQSATLVVPADAAAWANDRESLWNAAELAEKRKNSTVAREFEVALPRELSPAERQRLAVDFAGELVARHGCAADVAIHAPGKEGDNRNHHAHILLTTRRLTADGMGEKTRELDDQKTGKELVTEWRERFAVLQNERLREAGHAVQVDHRSHAERGLQSEPSQHLGPAATGYERRTGQRSRIGQDFDEAAAERLRQEQEAAELEQQEQAVDRSILDVTDGLKASLRAQKAAQAPTPTPAPVRAPAPRLDPAEAEKQRLARMSSAELAEEISRRRPPNVDSVIEQTRSVMESTAKRRELYKQEEAGKAAVRNGERAIDDWREKHPNKAKMHDAGLWRSADLEQLGEQLAADSQALQTVQLQARAVEYKDTELRQVVRSQVVAGQAEGRAKVAELEKLHLVKAKQERAEAGERRRLEAVPKEFRAMAASREAGALGWSDKGSKWLAAPEPLKKLIDGYNAAPNEIRATMLDRIGSEQGSKQLRALLDTQQRESNNRRGGLER